MWERRYGFPKPPRDDNGERQYTVPEIAKLRAIKRLMDVGMRPGKIIHCDARRAERACRGADRAARARVAPGGRAGNPRACSRATTRPALQNSLANLLMRQGLQRFVLETLASLNRAVGDAWMRGELAVFEEHLYTEQRAGRAAHGDQRLPATDRNPAGPADDLSRRAARRRPADGRGAARRRKARSAFRSACRRRSRTFVARRSRYDVHVVALSFSSAFPVRQAGDGLAALRRQLPPKIALWAGGEMTRRVRKALPGVTLVADLAATLGALKAWRQPRP